jgi:hypothetical protein
LLEAGNGLSPGRQVVPLKPHDKCEEEIQATIVVSTRETTARGNFFEWFFIHPATPQYEGQRWGTKAGFFAGAFWYFGGTEKKEFRQTGKIWHFPGLFYRTSSSVRLWWELEEPKGPKEPEGMLGARRTYRT